MVVLVGGDHQGALGQGLSQNLRVHVFVFGRLLEGLGDFAGHRRLSLRHGALLGENITLISTRNKPCALLKMVFLG